MHITQPGSDHTERQRACAAYARNAQEVLRFLATEDPKRAPADLVFSDFRQRLVRVPLVEGCEVDDPEDDERKLSRLNLWTTPAVPESIHGLLGPRTAWEIEHTNPRAGSKPRVVIWVLGSPLALASIDGIEDALVISPGHDAEETVRCIRMLDVGAVGIGTTHLLLRTHARTRASDEVTREVEVGRALGCSLDRRGPCSVSTMWRPLREYVHAGELHALVEAVRDRVKRITTPVPIGFDLGEEIEIDE